MVQDVRQWLEEVKRLQQQLGEITQERDEALESAAQWRQLYNTEAQQRRKEIKEYQQIIETLKTEIQALQSFSGTLTNESQLRGNYEQEIAQLETFDEVKSCLLEVFLEREKAQVLIHQLTQSLEEEKVSHGETRERLTTALGDAVDLLAKHQLTRSKSSVSEVGESVHGGSSPSNSLLKLPPLQS